MINDPELKAMSDVYDALKGLDADTRQRVADWVLGKLRGAGAASSGKKRGRKPGKRGRPKGAVKKSAGAKRGRKPGRPKGAKRGRKPGRPKKVAAPAVKTSGKRGRPKGSGKKSTGGKRGRPRKIIAAPSGTMGA